MDNQQQNYETENIIIDPGTKRVFPSDEGFNRKRRLRRFRKVIIQNVIPIRNN